MRLIIKEIIIGYELMRFASALPFLSNGSYLSLFKGQRNNLRDFMAQRKYLVGKF